MKRYLGLIASCAAALLLAGCTLPGEQAQDDDFIPSGSYSEDSGKSDESIVNYHWSVEPKIMADNILVFDGSQIDPDSDVNTMYENVAIISRSGLYGFIDYKGNVLVNPDYKYYYICSCGQIVLYNISEEDEDVREYCTMDDQGKIVDYVTEHESSRIEYYYDETDGSIYYAREAEGWQVKKYTDKKTVVACKAEVAESAGEYYADVPDEPVYGLVKQDEVVLDFEYSDYYAPAYKGAGITAIALKKDGKWGYVNSAGEEIIGFDCDEIFSSYNGEYSDSQESGHPYLFSEDFVAVSMNYSFGYYDIDGNCIVRSNEFEQARPVHRGKAWVCSGGMWGVIRFGEEEEEEAITMTTTTTTTTTTSWTTTPSSTSQSVSSAPEETSTKQKTTAPELTDPTDDTEPVVTDPIVTETEPVITDPEPTEPIVTNPPELPEEPVY